MTLNANYRRFLDRGIIETIEEPQLREALNNADKCRLPGARSLLITLYHTGCRPAECLILKARNITREGHFISIYFEGGIKGSFPRTIVLKDSEFPRELWAYASSLHPDMFLFYSFSGKYIHRVTNKKGISYERIETTAKLRKHIPKWFTGIIKDSINPYFLRHNFFSKLAAKGVPRETMRILKGAKNDSSLSYYSHLSTKSARDVAKLIK